jgi:fructose-1,6-bisphosphatase/inositol monophosphatase family enzyme
MENDFLIRMQDIARRGGELALSLIENSEPKLKPDTSVLTKADTAISQLVKESLKDLLATKEHILIDEEDPEGLQYFNQAKLEAAPYVWSVDPIDGTRSFSNRIPLYGISIGLFKNLRPWLGLVYFPALNELFYCDGNSSYFVKNAFRKDEIKVPIKPIDQKITRQSILFGDDVFFVRHEWDLNFCQIMLASCAIVNLCWPAIGRGCGCIFKSNLWDFAGSWPIFFSAGLELRSLSTGKVMEKLNTDLFVGEGSKTWRLKEYHILSSEHNFSLIKERIKEK